MRKKLEGKVRTLKNDESRGQFFRKLHKFSENYVTASRYFSNSLFFETCQRYPCRIVNLKSAELAGLASKVLRSEV